MKLNVLSLAPLVSFQDIKSPVDWAGLFRRSAPTDVEIGFGTGEVLIREATRFPHRNFVGIEQDWGRISKALYKIASVEMLEQKEALNNIKILKADARVSFARFFPQQSISRIDCLFPCPWPKKKHVRHRLFSGNFFKLLNSRLTKRGKIKIVTDFYPYFKWILKETQWAGFKIFEKEVCPQYGSKFEKKWCGKGQENFFELKMIKEKHFDIPLEEDNVLMSYKLENFCPDKFRFKNKTGDVSVIFKEMIFDPEKQKAEIHLIVSEQGMTQHFRVSVRKGGEGWNIYKSDGQNFFPTQGIVEALRLVYEAAVQVF